jgi:uncharacterized membrane protein YhaH (DUF805 family)
MREYLRRRDFYAGGLMVLIGLGVALKGLSYRTGTLMHMGPGFLPTALGVLLAVLGIAIAITAQQEHDGVVPTKPQWWGWFCILAGPILFIALGHNFGMIPATFACVFVSALGDRTASWQGSLVLAMVVTAIGVGLFTYLLHIPMPILTIKGVL